ncbi:sulfotransferase [Aliiglaciecola sp. LCG003]|uniref:sulfotransferase n=1 Tax=Aliiglaciecola sp. LCG003 TaxID=3053655 RepID=UPI0025743580|nr:sulfotransferase [Aliiglaciecola sp. LCG003]WJG09309.1 sulfotransferase [Aliiglaciecola sp. LCG003]
MNNSLRLLRKLADQQQYSELRELSQSIWHETQDPAVLPLLALSHGLLGDTLQAEQTFEQAQLYQTELDLDSLVDLAAVCILMQQLDSAVALLDHVVTQQPEHALALARLGQCRMHEENAEAAQNLFKQAFELEPQRIAVAILLIHLQLDDSHYEAAQATLHQAYEALAQISAELPDGLNQQHLQQLQDLQIRLWVEQQEYAFAERWLQEQFAALQQDEISKADFIHRLSHYAQLLAGHDLHQQAEEILREYLKSLPHNISLCMQLSELYQVQGHFVQGINLVRKALKLEPDNIGLWVKLALISMHRFEGKARHAAQKAVALAEVLQPNEAHPVEAISLQQAQASNALAMVESQEQNFELAERMFRKILIERKNFIPALQGLAQQQMQRGQIDEAIELFERVKQLDPIKGYAGLINARRFPEDESVLDKLAKAAKMPSLEGPLCSGLLFQLAAAWEKRGDYPQAFEFAKQANQASKKFLPYDAKAHRNQCARIRYGFSKALFEHRREHGVQTTLPVFVVGMPRSGTTLVEQIIASHSQIFGAGELGLIPQVAQGLNRWERHVGSGRSYPDCVDDLTPEVSAGIANNILKEMQELAPDAKHVVDKLPHNFEHIGLIKFLFPNAKIISVRRDPRDIAISNYFTDYQAKHGGMGFAYDLTDIGEQLADHNLMMHHWQQLFTGDILEVNYENVVDELEIHARKMLQFIGVEWEPQVLDFNKLDRTVKTASVWQVRQPIYKSSKARWVRYKDYLAPLIKGTNAKCQPDPINDMLSLPEPGFLTNGVELFHQGDLDGAELRFKKMLHHNPEHAACLYMTGLVYLQKGHMQDGIAMIEKALAKVPWQQEWRDNLQRAYREVGEHDKANKLDSKAARRAPLEKTSIKDNEYWQDDTAQIGEPL